MCFTIIDGHEHKLCNKCGRLSPINWFNVRKIGFRIEVNKICGICNRDKKKNHRIGSD